MPTARNILIAPDSFKGSAAAADVALAMSNGWLAARPNDRTVLVPMADGGEGTIDAFEQAIPLARRIPVTVTGPNDRPVSTSYLLLPGGDAVVELACTSGLSLLHPLAPMTAHTRGFGEAIVHALDSGANRLVLAIGGSSSTDGGVGVLRALGARFVDDAGRDVAAGGVGLADISEVELAGLRPLPPGGALVLTDVSNPLLGARGAAAVFGPQKGASEAQVTRLDANLARLAALVGLDPQTPGAGAAGGTAFGLLAWGAELTPGSRAVGEIAGLPTAARDASLIITGEGRFDDQSLHGKVISHLLELAGERGTPVALIAGLITTETSAFVATASLTQLAGAERAMADPLTWITEAARLLARSLD